MTLNFPSTPSVGDVFETWRWDGVRWAPRGINLDAPENGNLYGRKDGLWEEVPEGLTTGEVTAIVQSSANPAIAAAATAQSTANTASANASAAVSTANTANSNASTALSSINGAVNSMRWTYYGVVNTQTGVSNTIPVRWTTPGSGIGASATSYYLQFHTPSGGWQTVSGI